MNKKYKVYQLKTYYSNFINYCYIVTDSATQFALIIDPSWELKKIIDVLNSSNTILTTILLTHSHYDHVNLVDSLIRQFNARVLMSKIEIDYYGFRCRNLSGLNDNDDISLGGTKIYCLHTPGHTAGSMSYLLPDSLFTGDTIFTEGCGICNTKGGSPEKMFESIRRIKSEISKGVRIYPAHSYGIEPGQTLEFLMKENIYFQIDKRECFLDFRMRKNQKGLFDFK